MPAQKRPIPPFSDKETLAKHLNDFIKIGMKVVEIGVDKDANEKVNFAMVDFDINSDKIGPYTVEFVSPNASKSKDDYLKFLAPLMDAHHLVDRAIMALTKGDTVVDTDTVVLRPAPLITQLPSDGKLHGDGTWPWSADIVGDDIVVRNAKSTCFGGASDPQDSGATASGVSTKDHPELKGCALPMRFSGTDPKTLAALGGSPIPKMPFGVNSSGTDIPSPNGTHVEVTDPSTGKKLIVPVVDVGPAKKTGHPLDLTIAAAKVFNPSASATNFSMRLDFRIIGGKKFVADTDISKTVADLAATSGVFIQRLVGSTKGELALVGDTVETKSPLKERIEKYWGDLGLTFPGVDEAWSAVFVSWNVLQAGATKDNFTFSQRHSQFVFDAINRKNATPAFIAHKIGDYAPKVGDIIQNNRSGNKFEFDDAKDKSKYESHSAIVVETGVSAEGKRFLVTIGGNESEGIRDRRVNLDSNGKLVQPTSKHFICVLENIM